MSNIIKKICKSCGLISLIENNKCTQCGAKYTEGDVAKITYQLEQQQILPGILKPKIHHTDVNKPTLVDASSYGKIRVKENKKSGNSNQTIGQMEFNKPTSRGASPYGGIPIQENKQSDEYVEARRDYDDEHFQFKKGDIITVTNKKIDGFIDGRIGTLEVTFPAKYSKPFDNYPERLMQIVVAVDVNYEGILKVEVGDIVKLKNKYSDYYWVEYKGEEGWIPVICADFTSSNEENKEEIRIILLGKTGSGKSATGNLIIGNRIFKSNLSGKSVTKNCQKFEGKCNGKQLVIIDTPGLFDTTLSHTAINDELIRCAHLSLPGPHVFLIVLQITRLTNEETEALEQLFDIFGTSMGNYSIIVFTRSDELKREGKSIESFVEETGLPITDFIRKCNDRYIAIDNHATGQDKDEMVTALLKVITDVVNDNSGCHFTNKIIEEAGEALITLNTTENLQQLDESLYNPDDDEDLFDDDFDEDECDSVSVESHDSGVSVPNQPIYDEIHAEFRSTVINLNNRIDETQLEIKRTELFRKNVQVKTKKDIEEIDVELKKKKAEVLEVTVKLNHVTNQYRKCEHQKRGLEREVQIDLQECDLKLKQLIKTKKGLEKQKKQIEQKKTELRQKISKESESLQTKLNTPENGCFIM